jgi:hypothetical protein
MPLPEDDVPVQALLLESLAKQRDEGIEVGLLESAPNEFDPLLEVP